MVSCPIHLYRFWLLSSVAILLLISLLAVRRQSPAFFLTEADVLRFTPEQKILPQRIPRLIHQTWKNSSIPSRWNSSVQSVRALNAEKFEYRLWTDEDIDRFVREKEAQLYLTTFSKYSYDIQRVDAFRYVLLYHLGGIYIDVDAGCSQPLDSLLDVLEALDPRSPHLAALPTTRPMGLSNDFIISTPGHPFFGQLISRLPLFDRHYLLYYLTVMLSAGPLFVTINERLFDSSTRLATVRILDEKVYSELFLWFAGGSSWHGRDARIIGYVYGAFRTRDWPRLFLIALLFFLPFCLCLRCCLRRRKLSFIPHQQ